LKKPKVKAKLKAFTAAMYRKFFDKKSLSEKVGISPQFLSSFLNGNYGMRPEVCKNICNALGVEFDDIFEVK
jgi:DNA-binding Xre family transcriptional regulator